MENEITTWCAFNLCDSKFCMSCSEWVVHVPLVFRLFYCQPQKPSIYLFRRARSCAKQSVQHSLLTIISFFKNYFYPSEYQGQIVFLQIWWPRRPYPPIFTYGFWLWVGYRSIRQLVNKLTEALITPFRYIFTFNADIVFLYAVHL